VLRRFIKKALARRRGGTFKALNWIELNQERMLQNVECIQRQQPNLAVIPVLKGNAYGHGLEQVAEMLNATTCTHLAVDGYFEAAKIRDITTKRILVMGYILPDNTPLLDVKRCSFVVQDIAGLRAFAALGKPVRVHLEINTGMNRLGLQPSEIVPYLEELRRHPTLQLEGVMTHLADADNELDEHFNDRQIKAFDAQVSQILDAGFSPILIHCAQTAGSVKARSRYANAMRLGIGAYGLNPLLSSDPYYTALANLQPILTLKSTIIKVLELQKGDHVSYGLTYTAPKTMRIGVLPLGYYEGLPRELSNKGSVTSDKGDILPIVGKVCMNHVMIDLTGTNLRVLDKVTVFSNDSTQPNTVLNMQTQHGLFAYTTVVGLAASVRRVILREAGREG